MPSTRTSMLGAIIAVAVLAAALRMWHLGVAPLNDSEAIAALVARQVALGGGYEHFPGGHGPLPYLAGALSFRAFGIDDATARIAPAVFGLLLALLPFTMMRQLGRAGAIASALMLAVSPVMITYSRIAGPDIVLGFLSLALAGILFRYVYSEERAWLYVAAAVLALMFATSEMALVITPIFVVFLSYLTAADIFNQSLAHASESHGLPDHYATLAVDTGASKRDIRDAYHAALEREEDRESRERVAHAYGVLSNDRRRAAYDRRLRTQAQATEPHDIPGGATKVRYAITAYAIAAAWPLIRAWRERRGIARFPAAASPMLMLSLLALPFYGPFVQKLAFVGDRGFEGQQAIYVIGGVTRQPGGESMVMLPTLGALFAVAFLIGFAWRSHVWFICWAIFYGAALTLFTGFFTNGGGVWTGLWGTLDYWWRPEAEVNGEPALYYGGLLSVYELLPLAVIALGAAALAISGTTRDRLALGTASVAALAAVATPTSTPIIDSQAVALAGAVICIAVLSLRISLAAKFFAFWTVAAFAAFSLVEQKQPSLLLHVALPAILLTGVIVDRALAGARMPSFASRTTPRALPRVALASGFAAALIAGSFVMRDATFANDGRASLLRPSATSDDLREAHAAIVRAGEMTRQHEHLPIAIDTSRGFAAPWLWYLRDYPNLALENMQRTYDAPAGAVVIAGARNRDNVNAPASVVAVYTHDERATGDPASASGWLDAIDGSIAADHVEGVIIVPGLLAAALSFDDTSDVLGANTTP